MKWIKMDRLEILIFDLCAMPDFYVKKEKCVKNQYKDKKKCYKAFIEEKMRKEGRNVYLQYFIGKWKWMNIYLCDKTLSCAY